MSSQYKGLCNNCYQIMEYGSSCKFCGNPLELIKQKLNSSLNRDQLKAIKLIEGQENKGNLFGSFIFKVQSYPSDIDVIEQVSACCQPQDVYERMNSIMKNIIRGILKTKGYYFSEVKTGIDEVYNFIPKKICYYDYEYIRNYIDELYQNKLINNPEMNELKKLVNKNISPDNFDKLKEFFRKKYVIRWTADEVLKGSKKLPGNRTIKYKDALEHKAAVKIDMFAPINNRYIEVTNYFVLVLKDPDKNINLFLNVEFDYENQIKMEIKKYASRTFYKPFKMAKRMWGLARYLKNYKDLELLTPLFRSGIAILNQISSEIETMILMLEKIDNPPINKMMNQIDEFKSRISFVYEFKIHEINIDSLIDDITNSKSKVDKIEKLQFLKKYLTGIVNEQTIEYLKNIGLYPLTDFYLLPDIKCNKKVRFSEEMEL